MCVHIYKQTKEETGQSGPKGGTIESRQAELNAARLRILNTVNSAKKYKMSKVGGGGSSVAPMIYEII